MDCRAWPSRHRPALTVKNSAPPLVYPEHPLLCCLSQSLFHSFMISSLPLSHAVTPPDATHGPLALFLSFFFFSLLLFFLSFSSFFSNSPLLPFFLFVFLIFWFSTDYSCTAICFLYFITYFLILVLYYLFHCYWLLYYLFFDSCTLLLISLLLITLLLCSLFCNHHTVTMCLCHYQSLGVFNYFRLLITFIF